MTTTPTCDSCRKPVERTSDDDFQHASTDDGLACTAWPVLAARTGDGPMTATLTPDAKAYILAHDERVRQLDRLAIAHLNTIYSDALGNTLIYTGPMSHDELVNAIVAIEFPDVAAARDAYARSIAEA
jgi:hypothetical protein